MAPEQATGRDRPDARSDLYSLGAVGFFLLTGHPPFVRRSVRQVLAAHGVDPVLFPDHVKEGLPDDLQAVVLRCLAKDPADRFADAASLDVALAACQCSGSWTREEAARWWGSMAGEAGEMPNPSLQSTGASGPVSMRNPSESTSSRDPREQRAASFPAVPRRGERPSLTEYVAAQSRTRR
jgi:serine/threonine-protein kinase